MGTITNTDFLADNPLLEDMLDQTGSAGTRDATSYEIINGLGGPENGFVFRLTGTDFTYSGVDGSATGGTITGFEVRDPLGNLIVSAVDLSRSLVDVLAALVGSSTAALSVLFGTDAQEFVGSDSNDEIYTFDSNAIVNGNAGDDLIEGGSGDDVLDGGTGFDGLFGGDGNDKLYSKEGGDGCTCGGADLVDGGAGTDFAFIDRSDVTISLILDIADPHYPNQIGNDLLLIDIEQIEFHAGSGNDTLTGAALDDILYGGTGRDLLDGNAGNDKLYGGVGIDTLDGDDGDDLLDGGSEADTIEGGAGKDTILGGAGNDNLSGGDGDDLLDGGAGIDNMDGGDGDDVYIVDHAFDGLVEAENGGIDLVVSSIDFWLDANFENLTLKGAAITGIGNELDNKIVGNERANEIAALDGNDVLDGGLGIDLMLGGRGNDTYYVDNAGDLAAENPGEGTDKVIAKVSYVLHPDSEIDILMTNGSVGTRPINLTGNSFYQEIIGNSGNNVLSSKGGGDLLRGLRGDDAYRVYDANDVVREYAGAGTDRVLAAVDYVLASGSDIEILNTNGAAGLSGIDLTGNEIAQAITGNAGANRLDGKDGNDTLTGLGGKDSFVFSSALGASNVDTITDFNVTDDSVRLDDAIFTAAGPVGQLALAAFRTNATGVAEAASDRIIYDTATGKLFYDADGSGTDFGGVQFAVLNVGLGLTNADFVIF